MKLLRCLCLTLMMGAVVLHADAALAQARNASFVNPNTVTAKTAEGKPGAAFNTVVADPASIDAGETLVNVARRVTVFFYNGFRSPVQMNDLTLNADGNVRSKVITDDCKTIKTLPVQDKCSVALEITPSSPGPWSVELLLNHSGTGRISRAEVNGTTLGKADEKAEGLAISKKIAAPLDFGSVMANEEKAARTMLIENDSTTPLLISTIDLIASEGEGLTIRNTGCKEGNELKPGESCPITVMWEPTSRGNVATDLIVRHSGNLGFVVVPIRGSGTAPAESKDADASDSKSGKAQPKQRASLVPRGGDGVMQGRSPSLEALPLPSKQSSGETPSSQDVAKTLPQIKSGAVTPPHKNAEKQQLQQQQQEVAVEEEANAPTELPKVMLIGTVGGRAILGDADDQTYMVGLGEKTQISGSEVELLQLDPMRAVVTVAGQRMNLSLRNAPTVAHRKNENVDGGEDSGKSSKSKRNSASEDQSPDKKVESAPPRQDSNDGSRTPTLPASSGLSSAGLSSSSSSGSSNSQLNAGATAQDVLNMLK